MTTLNLPTLNEGETYAGLILKEDGTPSHHLVLLSGDNDDATWEEQKEWAKSIGGELPTRQEQALLYANCKKHFKGTWYWSGEEHATESGWAWYQYFTSGYQCNLRKDRALRARAVRRLPIQ